jgi:uncharacterized membrane protein SpoIIM required for sporulation
MLSWSENSSMAQVLSNAWILKRRPYWERLEALIKRSESTGLANLGRDELQEAALLYRQVAADLSVLRQDRTARTAAEYVNKILARSHHIIYSTRKTSFRALWLFFRDEYPATFQRQLGFVATAVLIAVAAGVLGAVITAAHPDFMHRFVGPEMVATMERHEMWTKSIVGIEPRASSAIMTNNISVCIAAFAGGITFGILTLYSMFFNGLMLGVIGMACHQYGMSLQLWSFVAAHGSLELPSIFIAGGAGFRIGYSMLFPGAYRWKDAVAQAGSEAVRLIVGAIPLLVIAGILEGFLSPSGAPIWIKFTVGGMLFTLLNLWLFRRVGVLQAK